MRVKNLTNKAVVYGATLTQPSEEVCVDAFPQIAQAILQKNDEYVRQLEAKILSLVLDI